MTRRLPRRALFLLLAPCVWLLAPSPAAADPQAVDRAQPMYTDPAIPMPAHPKEFAPQLKDLWRAALARTDAETRRRAAEAIADAQTRGMPGLADTDQPLLALLNTRDTDIAVRLAAARALIALEAKGSAPDLLKHNAADGQDMILLTDDALARWGHRPATELWMARLKTALGPTPGNLSPAVLHSTLRALGTIQFAPAADGLSKLVADPQRDPAVRLLAARAVADIKRSAPALALEPNARALLAPPSAPAGTTRDPKIEHLLAATLLSSSAAGPAGVDLLRQLALDPEPAAAAVAVQSLVRQDPKLIVPLNDKLAAYPEPSVRHAAAVGFRGQATPASVTLLVGLLNDPFPSVRADCAAALLDLEKKPELKPLVRRLTIAILERPDETNWAASEKDWAAVEQAAHILGRLDEKSVAPKLVKLLDFPHGLVRWAAATALRRLQVPDTASGILAWIDSESIRWTTAAKSPAASPIPATPTPKPKPGAKPPATSAAPSPPPEPLYERRIREKADEQLANAIQALGLLKYAPADKSLQRYVPKNCGFGLETRCSAIWALGQIHAGKVPPPSGLVSALSGRVTDFDPMGPETPLVQRMAATALGLMKAKGGLQAVQKVWKGSLGEEEHNAACGWAISQITATPLRPDYVLPDVPERQIGFFLEPHP